MVCLKADVQYDAGPLPVLMCDKNFFNVRTLSKKNSIGNQNVCTCMIARLLL